MCITRKSSPVTRKRDTGEQGNRGEFGSTARGEADVAVPPATAGDPVEGMRAQGRSGQIIASLTSEIDADRTGYSGFFEVVGADGTREFCLRPDGPDTIHAEYLDNRSDNYGTLNQAVFDFSSKRATFSYDFDDEDAEFSSDEWVSVDVPLNANDGPEEISGLMSEMAVDDGSALDELKEAAEDPDEAARDAYLRGIGVRRGSYVGIRRPIAW